MGCTASRINKEKRVQVCRCRKRLMKQLVRYRKDFADAQLNYMRALKNAGITLRQFTESDSLELESSVHEITIAPSPPPTLPPSPPPPPTFSPDARRPNKMKQEHKDAEESFSNTDEHYGSSTPPMPGIIEYIYPFPSFRDTKGNGVEQVEEENWAETKSQFDEEEDDHGVVDTVARNVKSGNLQVELREMTDDNSSTTSCSLKGSDRMSAREGGNNKTLKVIIKELDDDFLKASACEKEIAIFLNITTEDTTSQNFIGGRSRRSNSAKVFSAFSRGLSFKSSQCSKDTRSSIFEPCKPGAHCITLEKLYATEKKLYTEVKSEEATKIEHARKSALLQKQEEENQDWAKTEKTRLCVEDLESDMRQLQDLIAVESSSIQKLIDEELYPQLVALTSGFAHTWKNMYECHLDQSQLSQLLNHVSLCEDMDLSSESRRQASAQLESEVSYWYNSFCKLVNSQQQYVRTLCEWIRLTSGLVNDEQMGGCSMAAQRLSEAWKLMLEKLPDKEVAESLRGFLTAIHTIILRQSEEYNLRRKSEKFEGRLQKESVLLAELEQKYDWGLVGEDAMIPLSAKHPLSLKRAKVEAMKERAAAENAKYQKSVRLSKSMILSSLRTSLPTVFRALAEFTGASARSFEAIRSHVTSSDVCDGSEGEPSQTCERESSESVEAKP